MRPLASRRSRAALASAVPQSPLSSAPRRSTAGSDGAADPGGRHVAHTMPPAGIEKARCGPGSPHRAQSANDGYQPAMDRERNR
jgi:hypothetical protein